MLSVRWLLSMEAETEERRKMGDRHSKATRVAREKRKVSNKGEGKEREES